MDTCSCSGQKHSSWSCTRTGQKVGKALRCLPTVDVVLERCVYSLYCHESSVLSGPLLCPVLPAAKRVVAPDLEDIAMLPAAEEHQGETDLKSILLKVSAAGEADQEVKGLWWVRSSVQRH